jgi:hypothetical protein
MVKKLLLIALGAALSTAAWSQQRELALFMRTVQPALHPRKDIDFYKEQAEIEDSLTGHKTTVHTYYYFHKPTNQLRLVSAYRYSEGSQYPEIQHYYFSGDSLQKVGVFPHPKRCRGCYGVYSFTNSQLSGKQEEKMPATDTGALLMKAMEYELKAALLFQKAAQ